MGVFVVIVVLAVLITWAEQAPIKKREAEEKRREEEKKAKYSTIVKFDQRVMGDGQSERELCCKDGVVYNSRGKKIGSYSLKNNRWAVFSASDKVPVEIGHFYEDSDYVYLSLYGKLEYLRKSNGYLQIKNRNILWNAAECIPGALIDSDTCAPICWYEGDQIGAEAAFICWAYEGWQNKYSDFYKLLF